MVHLWLQTRRVLTLFASYQILWGTNSARAFRARLPYGEITEKYAFFKLWIFITVILSSTNTMKMKSSCSIDNFQTGKGMSNAFAFGGQTYPFFDKRNYCYSVYVNSHFLAQTDDFKSILFLSLLLYILVPLSNFSFSSKLSNNIRILLLLEHCSRVLAFNEYISDYKSRMAKWLTNSPMHAGTG